MSEPGASRAEARDIVRIHVQPRASKTEVVGRHGTAVKIRVRSAPTDGKANDELIRFVARRVGVAPSSVRLVSGGASRQKRIQIDGVAAETVVNCLLAGP